MESTNTGTNREVLRQVRAREFLSSTLPGSREASPGRPGRQRRHPGNNVSNATVANLALSGHTTTTKGHVVYSPEKAKKIAIDFNDDETDTSPGSIKIGSSVYHSQSSKIKNEYISHSAATLGNRSKEDDANNNSIGCNANAPKSRFSSTKQRFDNNSTSNVNAKLTTKSLSLTVNESGSRKNPIDRNHRSITTVTGTVIGQKNEVSMHVGALREECEERKKEKEESISSGKPAEDRGGGQGRTERRRRGQRVQQNESHESSSSKQSNSVKQISSARRPKLTTTNNAFGNKPARTQQKYSFLPTYIQPVIEENGSYQPSNHMVFNSGGRNTYSAERNRKISTEMNRYESSTSSSSSSDSDCNSPNRPANKLVIANAQRQVNATATPDTSDTEKRHTGGRRRRLRELRASNNNKTLNDSSNTHATSTARVGAQPSAGIQRRRSRRQRDVILLPEDKYVSLPDNYKHAAFAHGNNFTGEGGMAQLIKTANSLDDAGSANSKGTHKASITQCLIEQSVSDDQGGNKIQAKSSTTSEKISSNSDTAQLIIVKEQKHSNYSEKTGRNEKRLHSESSSLQRSDCSKSPELSRSNTEKSPQTRDKQTQERTVKLIRRYNTSETSPTENIRNVNKTPRSLQSDSSYLRKEQYSRGDTALRSGVHNTTDSNVIVQSHGKIKAKKVGEDYWPHDELTVQLLSGSSTTPAPTVANTNSEMTMQETIEQLEKFADDDTPHIKAKSRSNSYTALGDINYETQPEGILQTENNKLVGLQGGKFSGLRSGSIGLSKVQLVKKDNMSPCMSSTETLMEGSSGELPPGTNSRSPSIDSTISNSDSLHVNSNMMYGQSHQNNVELFIVESDDTPNVDSSSAIDKNIEADETSSTNDLPYPYKNKKSIEDLTVSLKNIGRQRATSRTDPILRATVKTHSPCLETLCEDPEPSSPKHKDPVLAKFSSATVFEKPKKLNLSHKQSQIEKDDSVEIDEGIYTEVVVNTDPHSFYELDKKLQESNQRTRRGTQPRDSDGSTGNDSARSLSDPSADRKRSQTGDLPRDSNLLGSLQTGKTEDIGLIDQQSCSSLSQISDHVSSYSDTFTPEECINESDEKSETKSVKKKSKSDPNPEGFIRTNPSMEDDRLRVNSASSEPNVLEADEIGDLKQFETYYKNKNQEKSIEEQIAATVFGGKMSTRRSQESMKSKNRKESQGTNGSKSIMSQLMAVNQQSMYNNNNINQNYHGVNAVPTSTSTSTSSSSMTSAEPSPVGKRQETLLETVGQFEQVFDSMTMTKDTLDLITAQPPEQHHSRSVSEPTQMKLQSVENSPNMQHYTAPGRGRRPGITQAPSMSSVGYSPADTLSPTTEISESPIFSRNSQSVDTVFSPVQEKGKAVHDMRLHAFNNLLETEGSYVSALRILYQDYMMPLKHPANHSTCEPRFVEQMFHKIPQLYQHHEKFYENVQKCFDDWNYRDVRLGELFLTSFNKDALLDTYTSYIKNYLNAREAVRTAKGKEAFRRFIEQCRSENKEKQGLADLMIKPVQRIPRYELLIRDMLKHTPIEHPDREGLVIAQEEIHKLAVQMNRSEKDAEAAEKQDRLLSEIEQLIEGCVDLCAPKRRFVRQDIVTEIRGGNKGKELKDRSLWLFSDLIVCSTRKRFRRGSIINLSLGHDRIMIDYSNKYKFLWKFPLEDVEHLKGNTVPGRHAVDKQLQSLQSDIEILTNVHKQTSQVECNHVQLDEALKEIIQHVSRQIAEKKQLSFQPICPPGRVELGISTGDGVKTFSFEFLTDDSKLQFERLFADSKRSLTTQKNRWEPTFMKAIPISRTRAGMQFSCAASNVDASPEAREVWVCNTDGYVGQVCFLTLEPEPNQTQCITVCSAKICCITQVPTRERRLVPATVLLQEVAKGPLAPAPGNPVLDIMPWDDEMEDSDEENTSPHSTTSSRSSFSQSPYSTLGSITTENMSTDLVSLPGLIGSKMGLNGTAWKKDSDGSTLHGSLTDFLANDDTVTGGDAQGILAGKDSMWLGTEDGKIHIYPSSESVRGNHHCVLPHTAAVHCILYHDSQVFVALSNCDLVIYAQNISTGEWDLKNVKIKSKVTTYAITKMVVVGQKELWCGCQNTIKIIDIRDHTVTDHFSVINDNKRQIHCMVCSGYGVWVALDKRPQIKLFHSVTHDPLADIDVSNPVIKMLASADAIIRQHKAACLRITALLICNDLLWVGTSAGVVLTLTLPKITPHTSALAMPVIPQGLPYGHTGHVRFLASAEIPDKEQNSLSRGGSRRASQSTGGKRRPSSSSNVSNTPRSVSIIISGGDGYEDFRMNSTSESAGRDDSTNHLLVWKA